MGETKSLERLADDAEARITRALAAVRRERARLRRGRQGRSLATLDALLKLAHDLEVTVGTR